MNVDSLRLIPRLGYRNVARVVLHRLKARSGWYLWRTPVRGTTSLPDTGGWLFHSPDCADPPSPNESPLAELRREADDLLAGRMRLFGRGPFPVGSPPDWHLNVLTGKRARNPDAHWSRLDDFGSGAGDIKGIWEPSRFAWAVVLARATRDLEDDEYLAALNDWIRDWMACNPVNRGPNWMCGQETALRLLHVLTAARVLGQHRSPTPALVRFVTDHCRRIKATLGYGIAQDNNHGTSETAGLYVGGAWLAAIRESGQGGVTDGMRRGRAWERAGRRHLIERVLRLVAPDGSFAQHSVNYHRMVVDTLSQVEEWRRELKRRPFPEPYLERCRAAVAWLAAFTDPVSGDAPNVGSNDGAHLFPLSSTPFRDFRPTVARGGEAFFCSGEDPPTPGGCASGSKACGSRLFDSGGYVRLEAPAPSGETWAMIRFPRDRFRPGDSDPLHIDLWHRGRNVLRDGGTFSYNPEDPGLRDRLSGPAGHNTIQFDDRDPMPRVGRFLRGRWLEASHVGSIEEGAAEDGATTIVRWTGRYRDHSGAEHERTVEAGKGFWTITDRVRGFQERAVIRWRLEPGDWSVAGACCEGPAGSILLATSASFTRLELVEGWESRYYGERTPLPVLEAEVAPAEGWIEIRTQLELRPTSE